MTIGVSRRHGWWLRPEFRYQPQNLLEQFLRPRDLGQPITLKLTEGQAHDGRSASDMLGSLGAGDILLADRAYDSDALRQSLAARGAWAHVKPMPNRRNLPAFSSFLYRYRNLVERFFNKLKHFWMRFNESMV